MGEGSRALPAPPKSALAYTTATTLEFKTMLSGMDWFGGDNLWATFQIDI